MLRLEEVVEQGEAELRSLKEDLVKCKQKNSKVLEEKRTVIEGLKASDENMLNKVKELEELERSIKTMEADLQNKQEKIQELERHQENAF